MTKLLTILALAALSGCATKYQARGFSGGFTETQLAENVFRVSFNGNGFTNRDRAEDLALLRCADLALKNNFSHFVIVNSRQLANYDVVTTPTQSYTTGSATTYGNRTNVRAQTTTFGGDSFLVEKPGTTNTIVLMNGRPSDGSFAYDAKFLYQSLSSKYGVKAQ